MNREHSFIVGFPQKPNDLYQLLCRFIDSVIDGFIYNGLSDEEDDITLAMSYYLDSKSEESLDIFKFINQAKKTDIGVYVGRHYNPNNINKLCWIEAKRLPIPKSYDRDEREYVFVDHSQTRFRGNGGIERFKLNKHGEGLPVAIMFGYVQSNSFEYWEEKVNQWLRMYSSIVPSYQDEQLVRMSSKTNRFRSNHFRIDHKSKQKMNDIVIYHFWLSLS